VLLCVQHLKDNAIDYMRNKCGVQQSVRTRLVDMLFSDHGLLGANDSVAFQQQATTVAAEFQAVSATLADHFSKHIEPSLRQFVFEPRLSNQWVRRRWTNNGCESINHILKLAIDWRPRRMPDLVDCLYKVVDMQMADLRRALHSHGNYTVAAAFSRFVLTIDQWNDMQPSERDSHFQAFLSFWPRVQQQQPVVGKTVTSSNGILTVAASPRIARKPGQRKRPRNERTQQRHV